uniref:Uncharacterized protein n=1 Tax=viral metagenome TaxID=1070528 RepID=A0A6C0K5E3_9ZZZZ
MAASKATISTVRTIFFHLGGRSSTPFWYSAGLKGAEIQPKKVGFR